MKIAIYYFHKFLYYAVPGTFMPCSSRAFITMTGVMAFWMGMMKIAENHITLRRKKDEGYKRYDGERLRYLYG